MNLFIIIFIFNLYTLSPFARILLVARNPPEVTAERGVVETGRALPFFAQSQPLEISTIWTFSRLNSERLTLFLRYEIIDFRYETQDERFYCAYHATSLLLYPLYNITSLPEIGALHHQTIR